MTQQQSIWASTKKVASATAEIAVASVNTVQSALTLLQEESRHALLINKIDNTKIEVEAIAEAFNQMVELEAKYPALPKEVIAKLQQKLQQATGL